MNRYTNVGIFHCVEKLHNLRALGKNLSKLHREWMGRRNVEVMYVKGCSIKDDDYDSLKTELNRCRWTKDWQRHSMLQAAMHRNINTAIRHFSTKPLGGNEIILHKFELSLISMTAIISVCVYLLPFLYFCFYYFLSLRLRNFNSTL